MGQKMILSLCILIAALFDFTKGNDETPVLYNVAGCVVAGLNDIHFLMGYDNAAIRDDFMGTIASFPTTNVFGVEVSETNYFDATLESDTLRIFTTDNYKNIEPEIGYLPLPRIRFQLNFQCITGNISLRFTQPLTDINNHDPYFEKDRYEYIYVQNSLSSLYRITDDKSLSAVDVDMTNNGVTFSLETNDYFAVEQASADTTTRQTFAGLTSQRNIEAPARIKLTLNATDVREPTRTTTTVLEVNVLLESDGEVPIPQFSNDTYTVAYNNGELIFDEDIRLANGSGYLANITQIGYEDYFKVSFANRAEGVLQIDLLQSPANLKEIQDGNIQFEIQLYNNGSSQPAIATVAVNIPQHQDQDNSEVEVTSCSGRPTLSKFAYVARYDNGVLNFEDQIRVTSDNVLNLTVTQNDWNTYFKPTLIKDQIQITAVKPLPSSILENKTFVVFDINVTKNNNASCSTGAAILIRIPQQSRNDRRFSFQRNTYVAFYDGELALTFQKQIMLVGDVNTLIVKIQNSNYSNHFSVKYSTSKLVTIDLLKPLERNDFDNGIILFDIVALSTNSSNSATASVVVVWNGPQTISVLFYNHASSFIYIIIVLAILIAISAAIGIKLINKKRHLPQGSPPQLPPPYTGSLESKS